MLIYHRHLVASKEFYKVYQFIAAGAEKIQEAWLHCEKVLSETAFYNGAKLYVLSSNEGARANSL